MSKDKMNALWSAGGDTFLAHKHNATYSEAEYEACLDSSEYAEYRDKLDMRFADNLDSVLISELYRTIDDLKSDRTDPKAIAALSAHLDRLLKNTKPIIDRHKIAMEAKREEDEIWAEAMRNIRLSVRDE